MYYLDYLRVYSFNFHIKDFKERQEDDDTKDFKVGGGDRGNQSWKKEKKRRVDGNDAEDVKEEGREDVQVEGVVEAEAEEKVE